ncbi:heterokaryon incompatibility protein-domain-containing protein [Flammula alnicola]|nr:heterokaryon incompatibility protein-domain-containing protein [Flammula alnicola]
MPLRSGSLVCGHCQNKLFSYEPFQAALSPLIHPKRDSSTSSSKGCSYTTQTWAEIEEGEDKGCNWCDYLWDEIPFWYKNKKKKELPEPEDTFQVTVRFEKSDVRQRVLLRLIIEDDWAPGYDVCCSSGAYWYLSKMASMFSRSLYITGITEDNAASIIPERNLIWQVSSPRSYELASACLSECTSLHSCPKPARAALPTRVLDCVDVRRPKLLITSGATEGFYVALSYVWGEAQPHSTCTTNIARYLDGIDVSSLPKTIQDAINCTHELGLRYLWIDSLCILQDSAEDKEREIPLMCDIYRNAYVTIIAASASKVSEGFLQDRREPVDTRLPFWCPDGRQGTISAEEEGTKPTAGVEQVDHRAWCYQERVLSPRALIYASDTLRYRCQAVEDKVGDVAFHFPPAVTDGLRLPDTMHSTKPPSSNTLSEEELKTLRSAWWKIVSEYSKRLLTNSSDKLLAISGIAQLFRRYFGSNNRYIAGLWEQDLSANVL